QGHGQHGAAPQPSPRGAPHLPGHRYPQVRHAPRGPAPRRGRAGQDVAAAQGHLRHGSGGSHGDAPRAPRPHQEQRRVPLHPHPGLITDLNVRASRTFIRFRAPGAVLGSALLLGLLLGCGSAAAQGVNESLRAAQAALLPRAVAALAGVESWESGYAMPVEGRLSSPFGWRNISVNGNRFHGGVDFAASPGTRVVAARSGRVTRAGWWGTYGYVVVLD